MLMRTESCVATLSVVAVKLGMVCADSSHAASPKLDRKRTAVCSFLTVPDFLMKTLPRRRLLASARAEPLERMGMVSLA